MSGKNYLKIRLTTQQLSFLISNILCKIIVNDLNNQNILKDIFEDKLQKRSKPKMMKKRKCWNKVGIFLIFKWHKIFSSRLYSMISFLQGSNNFKEVTIIERLLRRSLTKILQRIFEIRKEIKYLWIYLFMYLNIN